MLTLKQKNIENYGGVLSNYFEEGAIPISIVGVFVAIAYSGISAFMWFYTTEIHLEKIGGYFFLVYANTVLLTGPVTGKLLDSKGVNIVVYPCLIIFAIGMYLFSTTTAIVFIISAICCLGLGAGNFTSVVQAIAVKEFPLERVGLATSTFFVVVDIGAGFGPYALGSLVSSVGYRSTFSLMVVFILFSIVLYYFLHGRKETTSRKALTNDLSVN